MTFRLATGIWKSFFYGVEKWPCWATCSAYCSCGKRNGRGTFRIVMAAWLNGLLILHGCSAASWRRFQLLIHSICTQTNSTPILFLLEQLKLLQNTLSTTTYFLTKVNIPSPSHQVKVKGLETVLSTLPPPYLSKNSITNTRTTSEVNLKVIFTHSTSDIWGSILIIPHYNYTTL